MPYDPRWPTCPSCHVRHPPDRPHLPTDEWALIGPLGPIFIGYREQCEQRQRYIAALDPTYGAGLSLERVRPHLRASSGPCP